MYATKKIDFTYSSATIGRRFTLIRELELSKVWYQILLDEEFSLMIMAEKEAMPNDRHNVIASLDLVTNRYWETEELREAGAIRDLMENSVPRRYRAGNEISVIKGA
ncbi:transcriptional regulator [Escherichia coli]|uniref:transcriptional regulator n=1 Tax=Escherichia coli TaxID=562 RepID=UPI000F64107B|nr:transcriptional regulator [Escherichia coli]EFF0783277.1 transcriptional regulator [Escherichia albertii]EFD1075497.1 transcriptional regulator [Escherichia coli]EFP0219099.1 transcriptional regulator [Escherichia coli]EGH9940867.1 transcriptional regulator [Escherichia coli]EGO4639530.1 transcriptional regulator [Escherichia coli]